MSNLKFLGNVTHNGIQFLAYRAAKTNDNGKVTEPEQPAMVVDLENDSRGLKEVAQGLVDRGLAEYTNDPVTHSSSFVDQAQSAIPINAPGNAGGTPVADQVKARENLQKQKQPENNPAPPQASAPSTPAPVAGQPSAAEIQATANAA